MFDTLREMFTPEQRRIVSEEAKQALQNRHWAEAFAAVETYLTEAAKACDPDNKDKTQRIVISMQLLEAVQREVIRKVEDGEMARIEIAELERKNRPLRFIR